MKAVDRWKELAAKLKPDDPDERKWYLMALHRADQLEREIRDRRQLVEEQIRLADESFRAGRDAQALAIINKLREQYSRYSDLADIFAAIPAPPANGPSTPGPPAAPANPEKPEGGSGKPESPPAGRPPAAAGSDRDAPTPTPEPPSRPSPARTAPAAPTEGDQPDLFTRSSPTI